MKPSSLVKNSPGKIHPRKKPLQRRAEKRVADIVDAYRRLLNGDARRITTNRVAQEAGIPVSSLYQYFPNKEAIAFAVYRQWAEEALEILRERRQAARTAVNWNDFILNAQTDFFGRISSAKIVHQLSPVIDGSPELRKVRREYLKEMCRIVSDTMRTLGSDWPEKPLANIVNLLIELNTATFRQLSRQTGDQPELGGCRNRIAEALHRNTVRADCGRLSGHVLLPPPRFGWTCPIDNVSIYSYYCLPR
jgi:AcrR family transcriptional regulator